MKGIWIVLLCSALLLGGCAYKQKIVIPEPPTFTRILVFPTGDGGLWIDGENTQIFNENVRKMKEHCDKLTKLLEDANK